jgi:uncharacterized protein YdeI (YjbR/CyaY-like superfamily)
VSSRGLIAHRDDAELAGSFRMSTKPEEPVLEFASRAAWTKWLAGNHSTSTGVMVKIAKTVPGATGIGYDDALEVALSYGWIDARKSRLDDRFWLQRFTPRGPRSKWSQRNRAKALELIERGTMRPAGQREVDRARADGRWESAYAGQSTATVPDDLRAALDAHPRAARFFAELDSRNRYAILYRVGDAKRPETRTRRIEKFVAMLEAGDKIHP